MWVGAEISALRANKTVSLNSEIETSTASAASRSELNDFFSMDNVFTSTLDVVVARKTRSSNDTFSYHPKIIQEHYESIWLCLNPLSES